MDMVLEIEKELSRHGLDQMVNEGIFTVGQPIIVEDLGDGIVAVEDPYSYWVGPGKVVLGILRNLNGISHRDFWALLKKHGEVVDYPEPLDWHWDKVKEDQIIKKMMQIKGVKSLKQMLNRLKFERNLWLVSSALAWAISIVLVVKLFV